MSDYQAIFARYRQAWLDKDLAAFLATLSDEVVMTEYYGAQYVGKDECAAAFAHWTGTGGNQVFAWQPERAFCDEKSETAFFTWHMDFSYRGKRGRLDGLSLMRLASGKIIEYQEFEQASRKFRNFANKKLPK